MPERHDAFSNYQEDKVAANMGKDDVLVEDTKKIQERLQQQSYEDDREQERLQNENATERIYQLMKQEGIIDGSKPEEDNQDYYTMISDYVMYGRGRTNSPEEEEFFKKIEEIKDKDAAGEWDK